MWNTWPVCLVVGIMICEDVEISMDEAKTQERKAQGEFQVGEILLLTGGVHSLGKDVNPKLEATSSQHTATLFKANMGESSIFAVELKIVTTGSIHRKLLQLKDKDCLAWTRTKTAMRRHLLMKTSSWLIQTQIQ